MRRLNYLSTFLLIALLLIAALVVGSYIGAVSA